MENRTNNNNLGKYKILQMFSFFLIFFLLFSIISFAEDETLTKTDINEITKKQSEIMEKVQKADIQMKIFGTEYYNTGDPATIWLQLLRNYKPLNNASCFIKTYFPNKTIYMNNILTNYLIDSDGIYYYDFTIPETEGIYMVSATCQIPYNSFLDDFFDYSKLETYQNITISNNKVSLSNVSAETTSGYIMSNSIILNGINWLNYYSNYNLNEGNINFKILNSTNNPICTELGNISNCANLTSPVKLYAELTIPNSTSTSPEIDRWWVTWFIETIEEIRSSGEIHVNKLNISNGGICNTTDLLQNLTTQHQQIYNYQQESNQSISYLITLINSSIFGKLFKIQDEISSVNETVKNVNQTLSIDIKTYINDWFNSLNSTEQLRYEQIMNKLENLENQMIIIKEDLEKLITDLFTKLIDSIASMDISKAGDFIDSLFGILKGLPK